MANVIDWIKFLLFSRRKQLADNRKMNCKEASRLLTEATERLTRAAREIMNESQKP